MNYGIEACIEIHPRLKDASAQDVVISVIRVFVPCLDWRPLAQAHTPLLRWQGLAAIMVAPIPFLVFLYKLA